MNRTVVVFENIDGLRKCKLYIQVLLPRGCCRILGSLIFDFVFQSLKKFCPKNVSFVMVNYLFSNHPFFPCCMPELMLMTEQSYKLHKVARIVTFECKIEEKLGLKFSKVGS